MDNVRDKIAKLLALAESPNENEAKAALLKARALMVQHKLRPEEIEKSENRKVVQFVTEITCTKITNAWADMLSNVIAENYCCKAFRQRRKGGKKSTICFAGLEDDIPVCEKIFKYAFDCVESRCKEIKAENASYPASYARQMANAYGIGFSVGLTNAFKKQQEQHQEWGLVLVTPQEVVAATSGMKTVSNYANTDLSGRKSQFAREGYTDGEKFKPSTKLESGETPAFV